MAHRRRSSLLALNSTPPALTVQIGATDVLGRSAFPKAFRGHLASLRRFLTLLLAFSIRLLAFGKVLAQRGLTDDLTLIIICLGTFLYNYLFHSLFTLKIVMQECPPSF